MSVVILKYQDLVDGKDLSSEIQKAYDVKINSQEILLIEIFLVAMVLMV